MTHCTCRDELGPHQTAHHNEHGCQYPRCGCRRRYVTPMPDPLAAMLATFNREFGKEQRE